MYKYFLLIKSNSFIILAIIFFINQNVSCQNSGSRTEIYIADIHNSALYQIYLKRYNLTESDQDILSSLSSIYPSNLKFLVLSFCIPRFSMSHPDSVDFKKILYFLKKIKLTITSANQNLKFVGNNLELHIAVEAGKTGIVLGLEGSHLLENNISFLDTLYEIGFRILGIGHHFNNILFEDNSTNENDQNNNFPSFITDSTTLSSLGRLFLENAIRLGYTIDLSHLGEKAFWEVLKINNGQNPIIASHSNSKSVCDNSRNLSDAQLKAIADNDGVIGICFHSPLLSKDGKKANIIDALNHIVYIYNLIGPKYIALGTDYYGNITKPKGLENLYDLIKFVDLLKYRNLSDDEISMIMWKNSLRIIK